MPWAEEKDIHEMFLAYQQQTPQCNLKALKWFKSYLSSPTFRVKCDNYRTFPPHVPTYVVYPKEYIHTYIQLQFDSAALTKVKSSDALQ